MKRIAMFAAAVALCSVGFLAGRVAAQEEPGGEMPVPEWTKKTAEHAELAKLAGDWDVHSKWFMAPDQPPMECEGKVTGDLLYDGYFVEQQYSADFMGMRMEGRGFNGYDTVAKEWVSVWVMNMSPHIGVMRGTREGKVVTYRGKGPDWQSGKVTDHRMTMEWVSDDEIRAEFFQTAADGTETKMAEEIYTRTKPAGAGDEAK